MKLTHSGQWRIATRLRSITNVWIMYPFTDLEAFGELPRLTSLSAFHLRGEADLSALRSQPSLTHAALFGDIAVKGLDAPAELRHLKFLQLDLNGTPSLDGLRLGPATTHLSLWDVSATTDLAALSHCSGLKEVKLAAHQVCLPKNLHAPSALPGLHLTLQLFDVAAWLRTPEFLPPKVKQLTLRGCLLPDDPHALGALGVRVTVH